VRSSDIVPEDWHKAADLLGHERMRYEQNVKERKHWEERFS
jgi:hypothetical protein